MKNFRRAVSVLVGDAGTQGIEITGANEKCPIPLHVAFSFSRNDLVTLNEGSITIWNLNKNHLELLNTINIGITLKAGYDGKMTTLFSGTIYCVETQKDGADERTEIKVIDSLKKAEEAFVSIAYNSTVSWRRIVSDVCNQVGWTVEYSPRANVSISTMQVPTYATVCAAKQVLDDMMASTGLTYSIQNGIVQIKYQDEPMTASCYELNATTGLIGSPYRKMLKKEEETGFYQFGYMVEFLLNGNINIGDMVHLSSGRFFDYFTVSKFDISGDNRSSDWKVSATLVNPNSETASEINEAKTTADEKIASARAEAEEKVKSQANARAESGGSSM